MLITTEDAARILGLSPFTIRRLLREGDLPGMKVGKRQWRIRLSDLDTYLETSSTVGKTKQSTNTQNRIEELAREQGVQPISNFDHFLGVWPDDEDVEEFNAAIRELRDSSPAGGQL